MGPVKVDGETIQDEAKMAEKLKSYFNSVFQCPDKEPPPPLNQRKPGAKCRVPDFRPSRIKFYIKILRPNSAAGPDKISPRILQGLVDQLAEPLSILFRKSMAEGVVPEDWRRANVTPIFKKGSRTQPSNYRPVSLTSVPGKLMESCIKEEMSQHLDRHKLIRKSQHGFIKGRSCTTNLLEYLEKATQVLDSGKSVDVVYLDFSKAFDIVPTRRLLEKVKAHGITGPIHQWLECWLKNRTQRVVINGKSSSWTKVTSGVPQGSILGPILFAIFINDLEDDFVDDITILLKFADDTKMAQQISTEQDCKTLQNCLHILWNWSIKWGMKFNAEKCHVLHIGRNNMGHEYTLGGVKLASTEEERDIGVLINKNLKPGKQCERVARTANGVLSQILRAFSYRDKVTLPRIYKTYVRPHLEFAAPAWSPWHRGDIDVLEKVQKRLVKAVHGLKGSTYEEKLQELGLDSLEDRRAKLDLIQTFKITKMTEEEKKSLGLEQLPVGTTRRTQGGLTLSQSQSRLEVRSKFFSQRVVTQWNALCLDIRNSSSVASFKHKLNESWKCRIRH